MKTHLSTSSSKIFSFMMKTVVFVIPVLLIMICVNYFGDAAHIFNDSFEREMVKINIEGKNITNILNYDERIYQKLCIQNITKSPDIAVMGSSRAMQIGKNIFPDKYIINNAVSGASLEDFIAIYQIYKEKNIFPRKIIFGIDPWIFNDNNEQTRWRSLLKEYNSFFPENGNSSIDYSKYRQLFSSSYFQNSLENLIKKLRNLDKPASTDKEFNVTNTRLTDGTLTYGKSIRETTALENENKVKLYLKGKFYSIENYETMSEQLKEDYKKLMKALQERNIEIEYFLCPYQPMIYEKIKTDYPTVLEFEKFINNYAKKNNIKILGSYNPEKYKVGPGDFYDEMHLRREGIESIFNMEY